MFSPVVTIGGGRVVDLGRARRTLEGRGCRRAAGRAGLRRCGRPRGAAGARSRVRRGNGGAGGAHRHDGGRDRRRGRARRLVSSRSRQPWYVDRAWFHAARERLVKAVREFHRQESAARGYAAAGSAQPRVLPACPPSCWTRCWRRRRRSWPKARLVRARGHRPVLQEDEEQARASIERAFEAAGLAAPAWTDVLAKSGVEPAARAHVARNAAARETPGAHQRRPGVSPLRDRELAPDAGRAHRRSASACRSSRNGPASRANTPSRCWSTWIASASRGAKGDERVVL